jgi:hypothetical protein
LLVFAGGGTVTTATVVLCPETEVDELRDTEDGEVPADVSDPVGGVRVTVTVFWPSEVMVVVTGEVGLVFVLPPPVLDGVELGVGRVPGGFELVEVAGDVSNEEQG